MKDALKLLAAVAVLVLCAVGAYYGYRYWEEHNTGTIEEPSHAGFSPYEVSLDIVADKDTVTVGETFDVVLYLKVQGDRVASSDLILYYTKDIVETVGIEDGAAFSDYPRKEIDDEAGKVIISGISSASEPFTGSGTVATVSFKALKAGDLKLSIYDNDTGDYKGSLVVSSDSEKNILSDSEEVTVKVI